MSHARVNKVLRQKGSNSIFLRPPAARHKYAPPANPIAYHPLHGRYLASYLNASSKVCCASVSFAFGTCVPKLAFSEAIATNSETNVLLLCRIQSVRNSSQTPVAISLFRVVSN
jgi:hypothetical protein